ncbi:efflux transporter outer membrane subunit [Flavobacteriaceae bacterium F89]|uniref:Efflux transporter outer membrane subunit n=1 Tax=Cerina litoralis TaxID=2874477 RepID=A0AAE3JR73_9FLAO|nr:efflux transporter outer membrane subunit [Cerina litoralis]MCG2459347.1 efflux transporter outer membrane subunit [Cerina litoralis]
MKNKSTFKFLVLALAVLLLQSCFVAKDYERPEFQETDNLYRMDKMPTDTVTMADMPWTQLFTDSHLSEYIAEGLQNNLDIRIAIQQVLAAEAYMKQGKAGYWPSLNAKATATHQELAKNSQFGQVFNGSVEQFEFSGGLSWEADIWGKIRSNKRASNASYLQSRAAQQAVKTQLISQIAGSYYQLLALDEQRKITEETIENRRTTLETMKVLKDAGNVNQVAVDGAAAQLYNAQAFLIDVEKNTFRTENALSILLGRPAQRLERGELDQQSLHTDLATGLPSQLLRNRPDVMAAEYNLVNAFELTNVAKTEFYPSLTLSATGGYQSLDIGELFDPGSLFATLIGGVAQPIFNKRQIRTKYEVAQAQKEQALLNFEKTLLRAGQEVSNALYEHKAELVKYEYRIREVEALRKAEANSEELLNNGFGTYLDLLAARQNALNAELNVIDNKLQQLQTVVDLYRALGGGWTTP